MEMWQPVKCGGVGQKKAPCPTLLYPSTDPIDADEEHKWIRFCMCARVRACGMHACMFV